MSTAGTIGKFAAKAAAKIGLGAATGAAVTAPAGGIGALPGAIVGGASVLMDVIPLINDLAKSGPDPEKVAAIQRARDARADQILAGDPSMNRQKAIDAANSELKPFLDQAESGGRGVGEIAVDAAKLGGTLYLAKRAGVFGKKTNPNATTPGGPSTAAEPVNGSSSIEAAPRQNEVASSAMKSGDFKSASRAAMERGAGDRVTAGAIPGQRLLEGPKPGTGFTIPEEPVSGGSMPIDDAELIRMMLAAKARQSPRRPPGAFMGTPLGIEADPQIGRTIDLQRIRGNMYGADGG